MIPARDDAHRMVGITGRRERGVAKAVEVSGRLGWWGG